MATRATAERTGNDFEQMQKAAAERIPVRRRRPEDIANVVSFLVSEDASYVPRGRPSTWPAAPRADPAPGSRRRFERRRLTPMGSPF